MERSFSLTTHLCERQQPAVHEGEPRAGPRTGIESSHTEAPVLGDASVPESYQGRAERDAQDPCFDVCER